MEAFKERQGSDPDINRSKSDLNEFTGFESGKALLKYISGEVKKENKIREVDGRRALRFDAIEAFAVIVKPPADWIESLDEEMQKKFFRDSNRIMYDIMGKNTDTNKPNIRATATHRDEQGAHRHYFGMPYVYDKTIKKSKLCANELFNLRLYNRFNKEYPERMRAEGWHEIEDCITYDAAFAASLTPEKRKEYPERMRAEGWHEIEDCITYDAAFAASLTPEKRKEYDEECIAKKQAKKHGQPSMVYKADKDAEKVRQKAQADAEKIREDAHAEAAKIMQDTQNQQAVISPEEDKKDNESLVEKRARALAESEEFKRLAKAKKDEAEDLEIAENRRQREEKDRLKQERLDSLPEEQRLDEEISFLSFKLGMYRKSGMLEEKINECESELKEKMVRRDALKSPPVPEPQTASELQPVPDIIDGTPMNGAKPDVQVEEFDRKSERAETDEPQNEEHENPIEKEIAKLEARIAENESRMTPEGLALIAEIEEETYNEAITIKHYQRLISVDKGKLAELQAQLETKCEPQPTPDDSMQDAVPQQSLSLPQDSPPTPPPIDDSPEEITAVDVPAAESEPDAKVDVPEPVIKSELDLYFERLGHSLGDYNKAGASYADSQSQIEDDGLGFG
jgi:hypothetical protein